MKCIMTKSICSYSFSPSFILSFLLLTSCSHRQEATQFDADSTGIDTTRLCVAVMPAMNCLPVYYAERTGLADSLGLEMEILRYKAQMDIDTAIINGYADIAFTDLIRCAKLGKQSVTITPFVSLDEPLSLISLKTKRVKQVNQMKEQMIAISRLSATDYWCDRVLDETHTSYDEIYRPQINDVQLRADMLRLGLIDAAIMGEPYATWMTMLGHKRLFQSKDKQPRLYAWAARNSATKHQQRLFRTLLDEATKRMSRASEANLLRDILKQDFGMPAEAVDSLELQPLKPLSNVRQSDTEEAENWLKNKSIIKRVKR